MAISAEEVSQLISSQPCEKCGQPLDQGKDYILTFFRGRFIVLHEECQDFLETNQKGERHGTSV